MAAGRGCTRLFEHLKTKRLTKRVAIKPDGRYLIYFAPVAAQGTPNN